MSLTGEGAGDRAVTVEQGAVRPSSLSAATKTDRPRLRVLVADDSVRFGSMVARAFAQAGHDVTVVRGIDDGLALVLEESFDVVLTGLPFSEGRLARLARPMLLVTAFHELAGRDGWSEVIRRPFRLDGLVQRIEAAGVATLGR